MPQPPVDPKKKNMGLMIGGMLVTGIAMAILLGLMISGVFGGREHLLQVLERSALPLGCTGA